MRIGGGGEDFSPVELLLAAIAGCTAIDVDYITTKRVAARDVHGRGVGEKLRDDSGNHMGDLRVEFTVTFPEGEDGDQARERLPGAIARSHDRLCTVSRTVERGTPITTREAEPTPSRRRRAPRRRRRRRRARRPRSAPPTAAPGSAPCPAGTTGKLNAMT